MKKEHEYILSGLIVCPSCGKRMYGIPSRKKKKDGTYYPTYYAYACRTNENKTGHKCEGQRQISCAAIDKEVESVIVHHMWSPKVGKALAEQLSKDRNVDELENQLKAHHNTLKKYDIQINKMEQKQDSLDVYADNFDSLFESYARRLSDAFAKKAELKKIAEDLEMKISAIKTQTVSEQQALDMLMSFGEHYDTMNDKQKKRLMNAIIDSVEIFPQKSNTGFVKTIHLRVPLDFYGHMTNTVDMQEYLANPDWIDIPETKISSEADLIAFEKAYGISLANRDQLLDEITKGSAKKEITIELNFSAIEDIDNFEQQYQCKFATEDREMMEKAIRETGHFPPKRTHVETVVLLSGKNKTVNFDIDVPSLGIRTSDKATYPEIKQYIKDKYGLNVSSLYIAQIKEKCGLDMRENYNLPKSNNPKQPKCPETKEQAIWEALKYFGVI